MVIAWAEIIRGAAVAAIVGLPASLIRSLYHAQEHRAIDQRLTAVLQNQRVLASALQDSVYLTTAAKAALREQFHPKG